jgi:hypothetical protein
MAFFKEKPMTLIEMREKYGGRCFVRTFSGQDVDLIEPDPRTIVLQDIAYHLSKLERYNGACRFSVTVGAHSLMVAEQLTEKGIEAYGLLHDASEAYLGDVVGPLKPLLPDYREIENNLMRVILEKYGLNFPMPEEVKLADKAVLAAEMQQANGWHDLSEQIGVKPADIFMYQMPQAMVYEKFLSELNRHFA